VLLHRGRSKVRAALERYFDAVEPAAATSTCRGRRRRV